MSKLNATVETIPQTTNKIGCLVSQLPEIYQPIYLHPELSEVVSRTCEDRLIYLTAVHNGLRNKLGRPVRVLDLGCAQGFFSLNLAALGAKVHGVDYLDKNVAVCQALADEFPGLQASFETGSIEAAIDRIRSDQFDLVLGLSVFHHLIHEHGLDFVHQLLNRLSQVTTVGLFEIALKNEPLYWGPSQPDDPRQILKHYSFVHELGRHNTHLSTIVRPLYFASNRFWYLSEQFGSFDAYKSDSHAYAKGVHQGTRRYYFGEDRVVKVYRLDVPALQEPNFQEHQKEIIFLSNPPAGFSVPKLILHGDSSGELWLVREQIEGRVLSEYFELGLPYNHELIIDDVLRQLVTLEKAGLYHEDVRCWNILIGTENQGILLDYGAISTSRKDCVWPYDLIMSFVIFVREVVSRKTYTPNPIRRPWLDIGVLPVKYRNAFLTLFSKPKEQRSFTVLQQCIASEVDIGCLDGEHLYKGVFELLSAIENSSLIYEDAITHYRSLIANEQAHSQWLKSEWNSVSRQIENLTNAVAVVGLQAQQAEDLAEQLESKLIESRFHSVRVETELAESRVHAAQVESTLAESRSHSQWLENERYATKAKVEELKQCAECLDRELNSISGSRSWRYTRLLRETGQILRRWRAAVRSVPCAIKQGIKSLIKPVLAHGLRFVMARPVLKAKALNRLRKYPVLEARLRHFAVARRLVTGFDSYSPPVSGINSPVDTVEISHLTPRARQIYNDLKTAIEQRKKGQL